MNKRKILVIGSLNMDLVIKVPYMPAVGETIIGHSLERVPGGKGANQAFTVAKLGGNASMIGMVGEDDFGKILIHNLRNAGVDTSNIGHNKSTSTGLAVINVNDQGNNNIIVLQGTNGLCDKEYINTHQQVIIDSDIVILQMEIPQEAVYQAIKIAKKHNKIIVLNPAPAPDSITTEILGMVDFIIPNEAEIEKLTGKAIDSIQSAEEAAKDLITRGVKNVIVTLGSKGALFVNMTEVAHFPVPVVKVVDTTAAGDAFIAAFVVGLSEGKTYYDAITFANRVSTIVVMKGGAQTSIPDRKEVDHKGGKNLTKGTQEVVSNGF